MVKRVETSCREIMDGAAKGVITGVVAGAVATFPSFWRGVQAFNEYKDDECSADPFHFHIFMGFGLTITATAIMGVAGAIFGAVRAAGR